MRRFVVILCFALFANIIQNPAFGIEPLTPLNDCSTSQSRDFCLESIFAITGDGNGVKGVLNGITHKEVQTYAPESVLSATWQEYSFPGITFLGGISSMLPRIFYFPQGNQNCYYSPCIKEFHFLLTTLSPLGVPPTKVLPEVSQSCVGREYRPGSPWFPDFGIPVTFDVKMRIPKRIANVLGYSGLGRGVSNIVSSFDDSNTEYSIVNLTLVSSPFSGYGCSGPVQADKADLEYSQMNYWITGLSDVNMKSFGKCSSIKSISVASNAFWDSYPVWDPVSQSIIEHLSGPHFKSDGTINLVNYQAKITTQMAQCLWGVDLSKQSKAQFSITYNEDGRQEVQVLTANLVGDTYSLNVSGIHLSSPTIGIKLNSPSTSATPTPSASATIAPVVQPSKKVTITCIKGKVVKKVTAVNPKCPAGFKKK